DDLVPEKTCWKHSGRQRLIIVNGGKASVRPLVADERLHGVRRFRGVLAMRETHDLAVEAVRERRHHAHHEISVRLDAYFARTGTGFDELRQRLDQRPLAADRRLRFFASLGHHDIAASAYR